MNAHDIHQKIAESDIGERVLQKLNSLLSTNYTSNQVTFSVDKVDMSDERESYIFTFVAVTPWKSGGKIRILVEKEGSAGNGGIPLTDDEMKFLDELFRAQFQK